MQRSWRRQPLSPHSRDTSPGPGTLIYLQACGKCCVWAGNPRQHLSPFTRVKSGLHRQLENWFFNFFFLCRVSLWCCKQPLTTSEERARKFPGCMPMGNGCSSVLAKAATLCNGRKWIFTLAFLTLTHPLPTPTSLSTTETQTQWACTAPCTQNEIKRQKPQSFRDIFTGKVGDKPWHQPSSSPSSPALL